MKKIFVSDYTLRKLSDERNNALLFREKTALASGIEKFGADAIELAQVKKPKEDTIIYRTISSTSSCKICIPVGTTSDSVEIAWECVKDAAKPCLQVILPVSTVQMEYLYHMKEEKMLSLISNLVSLSKEKCDDVEFVALDATRASVDFLVKACETAISAGAVSVTLSDDAGTCLPDEFAEIVKTVKKSCNATVYVSPSDLIGMASACALSAIMAGADGVKCTVVSANTLKCDSFAKLIKTKGDILNVSTNLITEKISTDIKSLTKNLSDSVTVSNKDEKSDKISLDASSTLTEVFNAVVSLGYDLSNEDVGIVLSEVHKVCKSKSIVGAKELEAIIANFAMQTPSTYHLDSYLTTNSDKTASMTHISLIKDGEELIGVSTGNGPIDSAFRAIEQCVGFHYELDSFQIEAVTEGKEALGSALVKLRNNGKLYSGTGLSTDIISASIRAYINAVNKIVFEEK